ncbi:hypothetical protein HUU62_03180 [Rhodoferax sp. 4810]|nr:hypothetical protein [Rhodoferax jenense]
MQLSIDTKTWEDFSGRAFALFSDDATHIYIDTSLLMWLTKIGPKSFEQFRNWIRGVSSGRVHVPVWAGHEYANHHVAGTLAAELDASLGELSKIAKNTYGQLRPFLDADLEVGKAVETQQVHLRNTLSALEAAADHCGQWKRHYRDRTKAVMAFITEHSLRNTQVFDLMNSFPALGVARFDGRIPPGFQDRGKKQKVTDDGDAVSGSNKYGDLIFWREVLEHAKTVNAKQVILLSKDGKNDWLFGAGTQPLDRELRQMRQSWKPLPVPHPMLTVEARDIAGVQELSLIDSAYLGALLRQNAVPNVGAFIDVAVVPDPPPPVNERKAAKQRTMEALPPEQRQKASSSVLFLDGSNVESTPLALKIAIAQCRQEPKQGSPIAALVQQMHDLVAAGAGISELFTEQNLRYRSTNELATFSRKVHECVLSENSSGYTEAGADLIGALERFPEKAGGALLLGMLVAMYVPERTECRLPATSPLLDALYAVSKLPFAKTACEVIGVAIDSMEMQPLFRPTGTEVVLENKVDIDHEYLDGDSLASFSICGEEVLTDLQFDKKLNLRVLGGGKDSLSGGVVLEMTCRLFGIPRAAIKDDPDFGRNYFIAESLGFKEPKQVFIDGQEQ